jgi:hypothetical protein
MESIVASITPRKDRDGLIIGWQVRIRKKGYPLQIKTFDKKAQAQAWARQMESEMDRGIWQDRSEAERTTVGDLLDRYAREILPTKRGDAAKVMPYIRALKSSLGDKTLAALSPRILPLTAMHDSLLGSRRKPCVTTSPSSRVRSNRL